MTFEHNSTRLNIDLFIDDLVPYENEELTLVLVAAGVEIEN